MKVIQVLFPESDFLLISENRRRCHISAQLNLFLYSYLQVKKLYLSVEVITTSQVADVLKSEMGVPSEDLSTELDNFEQTHAFSSEKMAQMYCFSIQNEPFIFIDHRVIIYKRLNLTAGCDVHFMFKFFNEERHFKAYQLIALKNKLIPEFVQKVRSIDTNFTILKSEIVVSNNPESFKSFFNEIRSFYSINKIETFDKVDRTLFEELIAEYYLFCFLSASNISYKFIFNSPPHNRLKMRPHDVIFNIAETFGLTYISNYQIYDNSVIELISSLLKEFYPAESRRIRSLVNSLTDSIDTVRGNNNVQSHYLNSLSIDYSRTFALLKLKFAISESKLKRASIDSLSRLIRKITTVKARGARSMLKDVYKFEKSRLAFKSKHKSDMEMLHTVYSMYEHLRASPENTKVIKIRRHSFNRPVINRWRWAKSIENTQLSRLKVIYNLAMPPSKFYTFFLYKSETNTIEEYTLDNIESEIYKTLDQPRNIDVLLDDISQRFDESIDHVLPSDLRVMLFRKLRDMLYNGILTFNTV